MTMTTSAPQSASASAASASSASSALGALADEYWQKRLEADPIEATVSGDHRFDDRLPDRTPAAHEREVARLEALLARVREVDAASLTGPDRVTHRALEGEIENDLAMRACHLDAWAVDAQGGIVVALLNLAQLQTPRTPEQGEALVARWGRIGAFLDNNIQNLRSALAAGRVATHGSTARVITQVDELLKKPDAEWPLAAPALAAHSEWPEPAREALREGVRKAVAAARPAFQRYRDTLAKEILPASRDEKAVGISRLPGGAECYARLIKVHTSLPLSAEAIHAIGIEEIASLRKEMEALGEKLFGTRELASIQKRLRTDPKLFFTTREEVENKAKDALSRASAAFPSWFGRVPRTPCGVKRIEAYEEKDSTIAYYLPAASDGTRPGTYYINTFAPETRPRYEAEALAFHEAVPGHHSQIAIAQELSGIPEFRKHVGVTAYVEGWALYTERLADEMGLYTSDLDRIGMLSFSAWRASRLVVDTGMHALGWSRADAIRYMLENTLLAENNIVNEVDRYINWPGQALAYKIGEREILKLRAEAQRRLGPKFNIKGFHDVVLENGAVSLVVLREIVEHWITTTTGATAATEAPKGG